MRIYSVLYQLALGAMSPTQNWWRTSGFLKTLLQVWQIKLQIQKVSIPAGILHFFYLPPPPPPTHTHIHHGHRENVDQVFLHVFHAKLPIFFSSIFIKAGWLDFIGLWVYMYLHDVVFLILFMLVSMMVRVIDPWLHLLTLSLT